MTEFKTSGYKSKEQKAVIDIMETFFTSGALYHHVHASYDFLINTIIPQTLSKEPNVFFESVSDTKIYMHGFNCSNIRIKCPTFWNDNKELYPNDARSNDLNYTAPIIADISQYVSVYDTIRDTKKEIPVGTVEYGVCICNIPVMVKSKYCTTSIKNNNHEECSYDPGGYFIINGAEKIVLSMEKRVDNKLLIFTKKDNTFPSGEMYIAQMNCKSNDWNDNLQILTLKTRKDGVITISIASQLVDIPLIIILRAMGLETDYDIVSRITNNLSDDIMINILRPSLSNSMDDMGNIIKTKEDAISYLILKIKKLRRSIAFSDEIIRQQKILHLNKILSKDLLPQMGTDIPKKIVALCLITNKLLNVMLNRLPTDDRDALEHKRIETPGILISQIFKQNWRKMLNEIGKAFKKKNQSDEFPINVIGLFNPATIDQGLKTALSRGIWGINKTKNGAAQALQRSSWIQSTAYLRRIIYPSVEDSTSKIHEIRIVRNNQCQMLCGVETPESTKIGLVKSLALSASITINNTCDYIIKDMVSRMSDIIHPFSVNPLEMNSYVKVVHNGDLMGMVLLNLSHKVYIELHKLRINGIIDKYTTISFIYSSKTINILSDSGRIYRPLLKVVENKINISDDLIEYIESDEIKSSPLTAWNKILNRFPELIVFEDVESLNVSMVCPYIDKLNSSEINYTHCDLHPSFIFGSIVSIVPFAEKTLTTRLILYFSQARHAIERPITSFRNRMETTSYVLRYPSVPIVRTRAMKYTNILDLPYGEVVIIALTSYMGYNKDDSVVLNLSSVQRGQWMAETRKKYNAQCKKNPNTSENDIFTKPDPKKVINMKHANYDKLNELGFIPEETEITEGDAIIGKISPIQPTGTENKTFKDNSTIFRSSVKGVIDRVKTDAYNADGYKLYNVCVRIPRVPEIGDKFTCYDSSHEILTSIGWIPIYQVTKNHRIATLSDDGKLIYKNPVNIQKEYYTGDMYSVESDDVSLMVTSNHNMYVAYNENEIFDFVKAIDIEKETYFVHSSSGYFNQHKSSDYFIYEKEKIVGFKYCKNYSVDIIKWLLYFINILTNKWIQYDRFPEWIWYLTFDLKNFIIGLILSNLGSSLKILPEYVNDFQILCLHAGYYCIDNGNGNVEIKKGVSKGLCKKSSYVENTLVYCCTIEPSHLLYIRRNGKPVWCGNSNHGNKCTVGMMYSQKDMPFTSSGITPDMIINPHGFPSRLAMGFIWEAMAYKVGVLEGLTIDATTFDEYDVYQLPEVLKKHGFSEYGTEKAFCGITGRQMDMEIFIAPIYMIRLKHLVADKAHARSRGPRQALTRQPLEGRSRDGGLKIGEMEKDAIVAHGISQFLKERLMESSDMTKIWVCEKCGHFAHKVIDRDYYICKPCKNTTDISPVEMPYAMKVLMEELMTVNIMPTIELSERQFYKHIDVSND